MTEDVKQQSADVKNLAPQQKTDAEWRAQLTADEFQVARLGGTERAFSGRYWETKTAGMYHCACCGNPLFTSDTKYDSGTGWPSFYAPVNASATANTRDSSLGVNRVEVLCSQCNAHLGHVFPDGPPPTGERYCMNSASLRLAPKGSTD